METRQGRPFASRRESHKRDDDAPCQSRMRDSEIASPRRFNIGTVEALRQ